MYTPHRIPQHVNGDFHWFLRTRLCRLVTQVLIVALILVDAPLHLLEDAFAQSAPVFGPEDFRRATGAPQTVTRLFSVSTPTGAFTLCLANGGQTGQYPRVSSAVVTLNNTPVLRPSDFNQQVAQLTRPVTLRPANTLKVEVRSQPGSGFTLAIVRGGSSQCPWAPNRPPVADAGRDQSASITTTITLDGSGSSDVDGNSLTYQWSLAVPAGSTATLSSTTVVKPTFTIDKPGTYTAQLIVNDGTVNSESDTVLISTVNAKPVAQAGDDQSGTVGSSITLNGSGSSDIDGDSLTYQWSLTTPAGSTVTLSSTTAVKPTFTIDKPGNYTAQLVVHDGTVASEPDAVVVSTVNSKPVADAGDDQTVPLRSAVNLSGVDSSDVDGDTVTYRWVLLSTPTGSTAILSNDTTATTSFTADKPGNYTAQLIVNDGTVDSDPDTVVISTLHSKPVADAGADQIGMVNQLVTLDGSGSTDADNDPLTYQWSLTTKPATSSATLFDPTVQKPTFTPDFPGLYVAQVIVSDGTEVSDPDTVSITVLNRPPTATAGDNQTVNTGATVQLSGSGNDPDNDPLTYQWTFTSKPDTSTTTLSNPTTQTPSFVADVAGSYVIQITVSDPHGSSASASVTITARRVATNRPPTITSTAITTATVGQAYSYDVEATDPDAGDVLTYVLTTKPSGMTIDPTTGVILWTPTANQADIHEVTVRVQDQGGLFATQSFSLTVIPAPINRPPTATDDLYEVRLGNTLTVSAPGVLSNDTDPDGNPLTAQVVTQPSEGSLTLNANGSFSYTARGLPPPGQLNPTVEFNKTIFRSVPTSKQVMMTPAVIDLNGDTLPEIIFVTHVGDSWTANGKLRAITGGRALLTNFNLVRFPSATINVSSSFSTSFLPERAIDGNLNTSWFTARPDAEAFFEVNFVRDVTVRELRMFGNRESATGHDFLSGTFQLFDTTGTVLFDSGSITLPAPSRDVTLTLPNEVSGVRRVRFTATGYENPATDHGFAELEVIGDGMADPGTELWTVTDPAVEIHGSSGVAVGDIDLDGRPEIIAQDENGGLIAFEHDGTFKWRSPPVGLGGNTVGSPSLADLDGNGTPEILVAATVLNSDGTVRWRGSDLGISGLGTGNNGFGPLSVVADLDLDGAPEVVAGKTAFRANGALFWNASVADGFPAIGNFDNDPFPEIVLVGNGQIRLLEHTGTVKWGPVALPGGGRGGPPTIADVDADGQPEIGVAGSTRYVEFETDGSVKWQAITQDSTSNVTGSSVFDFEGDGSAEVVYGDELFLRIYRGTDGQELYKLERGSGTLHEIPTVADADGDGNAEIIAAANNGFFGAQFGIYVIGGVDGNWIPTRRIWNQHSYHITNVNADGTIPRTEQNHWLLPGLNAFRQNGFMPGDPDRSVNFTYTANDGNLDSNPATVRITLRQPNSPPEITSSALTNAAVGIVYRYGVRIIDSDQGDQHTFSLSTAPTGMSIDPATGLIQWTPAGGQLGTHNVTVRVQDRGGLFDTQSFTLTVANPVTVPNVVGQTRVNAESALTGANLTVGTVTTANSATVPAGSVISQDPAGGTSVAPSSAVSLVVSLGPAQVTVPNVVGQTQTAAQTVITDADLVVGAVTTTPSTTVPAGSVISQTPTAGTTVSAGTTVDLVVSSGPPQANRPPVARDDQYAVRHGQTLTAPMPGVLGNDTDLDNNPLTAQLVTDTTKGALNLSANGALTYTPTQPSPDSTEPILKFAFTHAGNPIDACCTTTQPLVIDLNKDGVAEIVFGTQGFGASGNLVAIHGNDGSVAFSVDIPHRTTLPHQPLMLSKRSELAAGDIDGDGFPEIIAVDGDDGINVPAPDRDIFERELYAFEHDGTLKWKSQDIVEDPLIDSTSGFTKPLIADLNGDGTPEIVVGHASKGPQTPAAVVSEEMVTVFDNQGRILWTARGGGSNSGNQGNVIAQDIDLDGDVEILYGDDVYDHQGNLLRSAAPCLTCLSVTDVAVANLDDDPFPEIVYLDRFGQLYVYEHAGVKKWGPLDTPGGFGLLTIGDADGDGKAEIVLTAHTNIVVVSRDGASPRLIPVPFSTGNGGNTTIFDLNGDGKPELIHNGQFGPFDTGAQIGALYIFDGQTGTHLHSIKASRGGGSYSQHGPVVADVDGDGTAEIITGGWDGSPLIHVFKAKNGQWAKARPIYNQHNYSVTNVNNDGTIPARPTINWLTPGLNNYRLNVPLPEERTGDKDQFTYKANDGTLDSNTAAVKLDILPPNSAPSILSQAPTAASPNLEYLYVVRAVDPDAGEVLTFSLAQASTGMTIEATTGLIRWTPTAGQVGNHIVALKVTDSQGEFAFQGFTITVGTPVTVPDVVGETQTAAQTMITGAGLTVGTITNTPSNTVPAGSVISQEPAAGTGVPSGSAVNLVISSGPQGVRVPNVAGQTQTAAQTAITGVGLTIGTVTTAPSTTVPAGSIISQTPSAGTVVPLGTAVSFVVSVGIITLEGLTSIVVEPATPLILVDGTQAFTATGIFNDGTSQNLTAIVTWTSSSPSVASIAATGVATGLVDGLTTINATVNSITGNTTLTVRAKAPGDSTVPTATITTPAAGAEVTSPIAIIGTASDANFFKYELAYAPAGETTYILLKTGTTAVTNGALGSLDPTLLINDLYTLRLTVFDRGGNQAVAAVTVQVAREQKVGLFSITFQDLSIPLSGVPITINRTYDSRDKRKGDFGIGWRLDVQTMRIRTNRALGTGWIRQQSGPSIVLSPTDAHKVSLTLPDGKVEEFDMVVSPTSNIGSLDFTNVTAFTPRAGTVGTLTALANNSLLIVNAGAGDELVDDNTLNTYNPQLFRYTAAAGTKIEIHRTEGVKKVTDLNGNTLTFGPNGISHSAGKSVTFTRDTQGRITQITDPSGNFQAYAYDANGDLISHTDAASNTTRFAYNRQHGLLRITDPLGRQVARSEYDESGRLVAITSANGRRITFGHDLSNRREVITDVDGNVTVTEYDDKGNVIRVTDSLGGVTTNTYDIAGNQTSTTDPLGQTITRTFDSRRNLLSVTNALGQTSTRSYNSRGQITSITDPLGHLTSFAYDSRGNLLNRVNGAGITEETNTYDAQGNLLTRTDGTGAVTRFTYDAFGNQTAAIDPRGNRQEFTYDPQGNILSEKDRRGGLLTTTYDPRGLFTQKRDPLGNVATFAYDAITNLTAVTDAAGNRSERTVDAEGHDLTYRDPVGNTSSRTYDAKGNLTRLTSSTGGITQFEYDALARRTKTIFPDGAFETFSYDAAGRNTARTDANGNTTTFAYDAAGRLIRTTDALGGVTRFEYDAAGNQITQIDALGNEFTFTYNGANRRIRSTFPDGSAESISYDGAGRKASETDAAGHTTRFEYDGNGNLVKVTDAAGGTTTFTYDADNNLLTQTDTNGHTTSYAYDANGRRVQATLPAGQSELYQYDSVGNVFRTTTRKGDILLDEFDAAQRQTARIYPDGGRIQFSYTGGGKVATATDSRGTTSYGYDSRDRLIRVDSPDGSSLVYTYDAVGSRISVTTRTAVATTSHTTTYTYDALNRITSVADPSGRVSSYTYDAIGNLKSVQYPNGTTTFFTYNSLSRLTVLEYQRGASVFERFTYTVNPVGDRTRVDALDGSFVTYAYDTLRRLTQETRRDTGGGVVYDVAYTYDAVGNRLTHTLSGGAAIVYAYDVNDRLLSLGDVTFDYDANGNTTSRAQGGQTSTYEYDFENRLTRTVQSNGIATTYTYDAQGNRVRKTDPGGAVNYLVDPNNEAGVSRVLEEYSNGGALLASYVYGHQLLSQEQGGQSSFYHRDATNSTRLLTDASGNVTDQYTFDAFGQQLTQTGTTANAYRFAGEQFDPELGLYYLRARYYSPETGRFFSVDPFAGSQTDPMSLHRYLYANANPVSFTDPSGLTPTLSGTLVTSFLINAGISATIGILQRKSGGEIIAGALVSGVVGAISGGVGAAAAKGVTGGLANIVGKLGGKSPAIVSTIAKIFLKAPSLFLIFTIAFTKAAISTAGFAVEQRITEGADTRPNLAGYFLLNFAAELVFASITVGKGFSGGIANSRKELVQQLEQLANAENALLTISEQTVIRNQIRNIDALSQIGIVDLFTNGTLFKLPAETIKGITITTLKLVGISPPGLGEIFEGALEAAESLFEGKGS